MGMYALSSSYGTFSFESGSLIPKDVKRKTKFDWKKVERIGREPAKQAVGTVADDTHVMKGVFYPSNVGSRAEVADLAELRALAAKMKPFIMVDGTGYVYGQVIIDSIDEGRTHLWPNSSPRKVEFTINLSAYGSDK